MFNIALLVPVCSRGQNYKDLSSTPIVQHFLPSFIAQYDAAYSYTLFVGYDSTDTFYKSNIRKLPDMCKYINMVIVELEGCEHKPAKAWNTLFKKAYDQKYDYFYQIGDDVIMEDAWTNIFIHHLQNNNNLGVVGGCHLANYKGRIASGAPPVIENAFVHKTHHQIFGTFFDERIDNWYCDDWVTEVYKPDYSIHIKDIFVKNVVMDRYEIRNINNKIGEYIAEGKEKLRDYNLSRHS
jgi:hypothetical protein|uniref:Glycosyltransferase 2-like domain-containing protein n=1 Tax=viral metagenome TaxID=1070528 RepID=A0A6C0EPI9_9ZZZZ